MLTGGMRHVLARRLVALIGVFALAGGLIPAVAAAVFPVSVRIEGPDATVFSGRVSAGRSYIEDSEDTHGITRGTAISSLDEAARLGAFPYVVNDTAWGLSIESINGLAFDPNPPYPGWMYRVNGAMHMVGADSYALKPNDSVLWYYGTSVMGGGDETTPTTLRVSPRTVAINTTLTVTALQLDTDGNATPLPDATVHVGSAVATSNASGIVKMKMTRTGTYGVRIEKADHVRSAIARVKVGVPSAIRSFGVRPRVVRYGGGAIIYGRLVSGRRALVGRKVTIQYVPRGSRTWTTLRTLRTRSGGIFVMWLRPRTTAHYRAVWYGDSWYLGARSAVRSIAVVRK